MTSIHINNSAHSVQTRLGVREGGGVSFRRWVTHLFCQKVSPTILIPLHTPVYCIFVDEIYRYNDVSSPA